MTDSSQLRHCVEQWIDPNLKLTLQQAQADLSVTAAASGFDVSVTLPYAARAAYADIEQSLRDHIRAQGIDQPVAIHLDQLISETVAGNKVAGLAGVKNIIAVASGKGGVGKSTTTVNLALALQAQGAKVGILDADIYGPSQGMLLGFPANTRPEMADEQHFKPLERHGIQVMSMTFLVEDDTPMVWRGPMVSGAMQQLLNQTRWQDLDYLVIDMPPGTGDIQLTLSQRVPVAGAVIVTTPQDIALLDARKGIEMFRKVEIPVIGVVENMSTHICSYCGHEEAIFGVGGGEVLAQKYGVELLGQMPLAMSIRERADSGMPSVIADPESADAQRYLEIAMRTSAALSLRAQDSAAGPTISVFED